MSHDSSLMIPPGVARKLARGADDNANAIVVGNRAGVIEWANDAWTRVTGYALDESISKPVLSFLRNVDVGPGIVDFVADCFGHGVVCEVEVPLTTPKGESLWIQLRVEPLRGDAIRDPGAWLFGVIPLEDPTLSRQLVRDPVLEIDRHGDQDGQVGGASLMTPALMMAAVVAPAEQGMQMQSDPGWDQLRVSIEPLDDLCRLSLVESALLLLRRRALLRTVAPVVLEHPLHRVLGDQPELGQRFPRVSEVPQHQRPVQLVSDARDAHASQ